MNDFLENLKYRLTDFFGNLSQNKKGGMQLKTILKYMFYIFIIMSFVIYSYSILFNVNQLNKGKETSLRLNELKKQVEIEKSNLKIDLQIKKETNIAPKDYLYNFYNYTQELSKTQTIPIIFKKSEIKGNSLDLEISFVKFLSIEKILRYCGEGKTILKIRNLNVKYEYRADYDLAFYTIKIKGDVVNISQANSSTGSKSN